MIPPLAKTGLRGVIYINAKYYENYLLSSVSSSLCANINLLVGSCIMEIIPDIDACDVL